MMQKVFDHIRQKSISQAQEMRDKARTSAMKRKEEYLGARVPRELREKVIARANRLGIPVSILIRNILEEAFNTRQSDYKETVKTDKNVENQFPGVIGWEQIILNRTMECSSCHSELNQGSLVTLGLGAPGEDHVILCHHCKEPI